MSLIEDKQRAYREKVLSEVRAREKAISDKAKEKRKKEQPYRWLEHDLKVREFKKLHPNKKLTKRNMWRNGELVLVEVCELEEDNLFVREKKAKEEKWKRINAWREKMRKAGIKAKPKRYHKPPRDLSIHTHDQCRVPALSKRSNKSKW